MAKSSSKNATKSFVMLIVTGVVLVAVTLCWFMLNKNTKVDELGSEVKNESSTKAMLYYGVTKKGKVAIERDTLDGYEPVKEDIITLEDMVPGAEYFYVAVFKNCPAGYWLSLTFAEDVIDGGLSDKLTVYCESVKTSKSDPENDEGYAQTVAQNQLKNAKSIIVYEGKVDSESNYFLYFSFKFADDATIGGEDLGNGTTSTDYRNRTLTIGSVEAVLGSVPPSQKPEEEKPTAEETTAEETTVAEETTAEETTIEETTGETNNENS